jgi:hypothetical protein
VLFVTLGLAMGLSIPAEPQERGLITREGTASGERFRSDFLRLVDVLQEIAVLAGDTNRHQRLERARRLLAELPPEQLDEFLRLGAPDLGPVLRANLKLRTLLAERVAAREAGPLVEPQTATLPGRPPIFADCNNIAHDSAFSFGALIAVQVADAALAAVGRVCDQVVVAAGFGSNTALVCLPLEIALVAAKVPFQLADFCGGEEDSSFLEGSYDRLEHVHGDLEGSVANDNSNRDLIIDNDNANTADIQAGLAAHDVGVKAVVAQHDADIKALIATLQGGVTESNQRLKAVQAVQRQIIRLLLTPEGRRAVDPAVLTCTGDDCPNVLACPGDECSFPVK